MEVGGALAPDRTPRPATVCRFSHAPAHAPASAPAPTPAPGSQLDTCAISMFRVIWTPVPASAPPCRLLVLPASWRLYLSLLPDVLLAEVVSGS